MEELIMIAQEIAQELQDLDDENYSLIMQRCAMIESLNESEEEVDPMDISERMQAIDAILSVNYRLMADNYAEMKRIDRTLGLMLTGQIEEEYLEEEDDEVIE